LYHIQVREENTREAQRLNADVKTAHLLNLLAEARHSVVGPANEFYGSSQPTSAEYEALRRERDGLLEEKAHRLRKEDARYFAMIHRVLGIPILNTTPL